MQPLKDFFLILFPHKTPAPYSNSKAMNEPIVGMLFFCAVEHLKESHPLLFFRESYGVRSEVRVLTGYPVKGA